MLKYSRETLSIYKSNYFKITAFILNTPFYIKYKDIINHDS